MARPLHIRGAHIWDGKETIVRDLYTDDDRIVAMPAEAAEEIDLGGYTIFPGLINAHDHLELNHYPRSKFRERYDNARQWHEDMNTRLNDEPYKSLRAYPLWDKLFIGGLKNLLCGATTVVHHNPPHKDLWRKDFPVRVLKQYGWSHSFYLATDEEIVQSYRSTPKGWPWFIHLAEGTDVVAASEYQRLKALGCIDKNTVIVHGVGMTEEDIVDAASHIRGLIWCPTTNNYLLQQTANKGLWGDKISIGSDSRLTAEGDWLDELRVAVGTGQFENDDLLRLMTSSNCVTRIPDVGSLDVNNFADFWIKGDSPARDHIALVVVGGVPVIGHPILMDKFSWINTLDATLDGSAKAIHIDLAKRIHANALKEPGLEVEPLPKRKLFQLI